MLQLAMAAWQTTLEVVLQRLAPLGVTIDPEEVTTYRQLILDASTRLQTFWKQAHHRFYCEQHDHFLALRRRHGLWTDSNEANWQKGPGQLVGACRLSELQLALGYKYDHTETGSRSRAPWHTLLLSAAYDLPGHIVSFHALGRTGRMPDDYLLCPRGGIIRYGEQPIKREAGLVGVETVTARPDLAYVVATDNWLFYLRWQFHIFRTGLQPLPMVVWYDEHGHYATRTSWTMLNGKRIVFWTPSVEARVLQQVVACDGYLSVFEPSDDPRNPSSSRNPGRGMYARILRGAAPWTKVLQRFIQNSASGYRDALLLQLEEKGMDVGYMLRQCCSKAERIPLPPLQRGIELGTRQILEQGDTWQSYSRQSTSKRTLTGRKELCNCTFRILQAIQDPHSQVLYYYGHVRYHGQKVSYLECAAAVRDKPATFLQRVLLRHRLGVFNLGRSAASLHSVALLFHDPGPILVEDIKPWRQRVEKENDPQYAGTRL
jgi:hypothetical protein